MLTNDPKILAIAFLGGIIPSLLWLWFWIREEQKKAEPKGILAMVFIMGMLSVVLVLPIQEFIQSNIDGARERLILWATAEEIIKYLAVVIILFRTRYIDEPIDWPIYLITAALGFAAFENALFLQRSLTLDQTTVGLFTAASIGQLRFLGSTLLHAVSSGMLGIALGISLHLSFFKKKSYLAVGLVLAIALHSVFNFFIIKIRVNEVNYFLEVLKVFSFLWVVTIIIMLLFEKVRRMT
ncbi:hypothetical protein A2738_00870 [Candidatus Nomurabacteria bacterium RIFCSPHIGHO2_01_FULL_42_15]|uniref:Protease PrsW n=1 Tax=Candidatus Nomurabacteria bacterium RIFCSPHIGHO2_01_FULL_42_15 TaxID=1801742 RepID=A0A1F6VFN9_9BACT|nr:MAG: hypothetical protein A2738_00870 [Candidatus Nomurabacteria bacterium RIFCSPHIGHO2_01_FULL_42_15]OGI93153.1 MAG: hypothetical protein A3A99_01300 [Candidatus Nomurabacteria bacterium RIFCSPLOWO2_01_FULL_41_18]